MSKENKLATMVNLQKVNKVLKKVKSRDSEVYYERVGDRDKLQLIGVRDASIKQDDKAVGGVILLLEDKNCERASPIYWKTKQIERVCPSSINEDTLILNKMVEDAVFAARQIEVFCLGVIRGDCLFICIWTQRAHWN